MKFTVASLLTISLGASTAFAALGPAPTPHQHLEKRQEWPQGIDISKLLEDPKQYLAHVSSLMKSGKSANHYAQKWASATNDPAFQHSLSAALASEFGTKTAGSAMLQYSNAVQKYQASSSAAAAASAAAASPVVANNADSSQSTTSAEVKQQLTNVVTGGASSLSSSYTLAGIAFAAIPAVLVAVL